MQSLRRPQRRIGDVDEVGALQRRGHEESRRGRKKPLEEQLGRTIVSRFIRRGRLEIRFGVASRFRTRIL